jgi:hypothetical protein
MTTVALFRNNVFYLNFECMAGLPARGLWFVDWDVGRLVGKL